jgi:uncharacterized protein (DUF2147 family)
MTGTEEIKSNSKQRRRFNSSSLLLMLFLLFLITGFDIANPAHRLVGTWEYEEKNLRIEVFEDNGSFAGKMIWFKCSSEEVMQASRDTENPDDKLADRKLLGLKLLENLSYQGENEWSNGKIYDPNSGRTYDACIYLTGPNTATVRGYWKFKWIGRSMVFNRL